MSATHPIIAITGSSGAGTTSVSKTFEQIFRREKINAVFVEGDAFHRYDRAEMALRMAEESAAGNQHFSHFGAEANLFAELEQLFADYGEGAGGRMRRYLHTDEEGQAAGSFTPWEDVPVDSELLFYEGLHGAVVTDDIDIAGHVDLLIGVVPVINLEWIQKLHRDRAVRAHTTETVTETILRRMPDYLNFIVPQFTKTHINFQRVPVVDTSNPFIARFIPTLDESFLVVRFRDPRGIDFAYLLQMLVGSFMSRANTLVCPGGKMDLAMQLIFTPMIWRLMERRSQAIQRHDR